MPKVLEAHRLRPLIELALNEGWIVCSLNDGGLKLVKRGLPPIFTRATALCRAGILEDWRNWHV
ncbi:MAG: hypothetical protein LBI87_02905 [Candidatus Accumulibacter sp.]|jgi:hypothetical protein|nr:hypothetical protein [Accumulibacter sp.]